MTNVYDILAERGFLKQCSHPEELRELLGKEKVAFISAMTLLPTACISVTM